jgi:hypothetical protein
MPQNIMTLIRWTVSGKLALLFVTGHVGRVAAAVRDGNELRLIRAVPFANKALSVGTDPTQRSQGTS